MEESVNKTIDGEIETLLSSYKELVMLTGVSPPPSPRCRLFQGEGCNADVDSVVFVGGDLGGGQRQAPTSSRRISK